MSQYAVDVRITGQVQGVAFRYTCQQQAERLGVSGWVRNETDGSVSVHAEGDQEAVDALADWCRQGPSGAVVEDTTVTAATPEHARGFRVVA